MTTVVFDLDGTLVDSAPDLAEAVSEVLQAQGRRDVSLEETRGFVGQGAKVLLERAWAATGEPLADGDEAALEALYQAFLEAYHPRVARLSRPFPGAVAVLEHLAGAGHALGLCTNKPAAPTRTLLQRLDLARYFGDAVVGGDSLPTRKPDPAPVHEVLRRCGGQPEAAVLVGDSPTDVQAAQAAGIAVVAVPWGYRDVPVDAMGADLVIGAFEDLPAALRSLLRG